MYNVQDPKSILIQSNNPKGAILKPKLSDFEAESHFMMQNILLKQQF